jgi:hypothetical protein
VLFPVFEDIFLAKKDFSKSQISFRKRGTVQEEEEEGPDSSDEETPIQFQVM